MVAGILILGGRKHEEKTMAVANDRVSIGFVARRTGLSVSAIRFYETAGLVSPVRNNGGQRRFLRSDLRRLSFIMIAQQMGFSLGDIKTQLDGLPKGRTPTQKDWTKISKQFRSALNERITVLERMRDRLDGCIGCGCLSLKKCLLYNVDDRAWRSGPGAQYIVGDPR